VVEKQLTGAEQRAESVSQYKTPPRRTYMPYAYRKSERLKKNRDFSLTMKGKRLSIDGLSLFYTENKLGNYRIGISVSKKTANAVKRNRIRRQIRDCIIRVLHTERQGYDLVFIARRELMVAKYEKILQTVQRILQKISLNSGQTEGTS